MKMVYLILLIIIGGLIFSFAKRKDRPPSSENVTRDIGPQDTVPTPIDQPNPYNGLRELALDITPEQLRLTLPADRIKVFGVVMDIDMGKGFLTCISFQTGDASYYASNGGGAIGGRAHQNVCDAARGFVSLAETFLDKTSKTRDTPLPDKHCVRFYLLTNKGRYSAQEKLENIDNGSSAWLPIFSAGNKVINELLKARPKK